MRYSLMVNSDVSVTDEALAQLDAPAVAVQQQLRRQHKRLEQATVQYGLAYTRAQIDAKVRVSIPRRFGYGRGTRWWSIDGYDRLIPDAALARYAEASATRLFDRFGVVEAVYEYAGASMRHVDPWLVGVVHVGDARHYIVLAYWDDVPRVV